MSFTTQTHEKVWNWIQVLKVSLNICNEIHFKLNKKVFAWNLYMQDILCVVTLITIVFLHSPPLHVMQNLHFRRKQKVLKIGPRNRKTSISDTI